MSKHQLIYTSCRKGMYSTYDGQNVFSHDKDITDESQYEHLKKYFGYREPMLYSDTIKTLFPELGDSFVEQLYPEDETDETGRKLNTLLWDRWRQNPTETIFPMHEDIIPRMPRAFIYEKQENGQYAFVRLSYLGHDYMGPHGRLGNFLSHIVWIENEKSEHYPCEYYKSSMLKESIDNALVSSSEKPDYLPDPELEVGDLISFEEICQFLRNSTKIEIFKNMLHAFIASRKDGKKIIICDSEENIMKWTAAIEYVFPINYVLNININSYVFDPEHTTADICGVFPYGTDYKYEKFAESAYVFDFVRNIFPTFDNTHRFYNFIKMCFTMSKESLKAFHGFLLNGYSLNEVDDRIYDAYSLYEFFAKGIKNTDAKLMEQALSFSNKYASTTEKERLIRLILDDDELKNCSNSLFVILINHLASSKVSLDTTMEDILSQNIILRFLNCVESREISYSEFDNFYKDTSSFASKMGLLVYSQLFSDIYFNSFINVVLGCSNYDKLEKLCIMTGKVVSDKKILLTDNFIDTKYGNLYHTIITAAFRLDENKGYEIVLCVIETYEDVDSIVNMTLNLEGIVLDNTSDSMICNKIWSIVYNKLANRSSDELNVANHVLLINGRTDEVYSLYETCAKKLKKPSDLNVIFYQHYNNVVCKQKEYAQKYADKVFDLYYRSLCSFHSDESNQYLKDLLQMIIRNNYRLSFTNDLILRVIDQIEYKAGKDKMLMMDIYNFQKKMNPESIDGKVHLLMLAYEMDSNVSDFSWKERIERLNSILPNKKAPLNKCDTEDQEDYLSWIRPNVFAMCRRGCNIERIFNLYEMTGYQKQSLILYCLENFVKQAKKDDDRIPYLSKYIMLIIKKFLNDDIKKELCGAFLELNKNKLELVDQFMNENCSDISVKSAWDDIKEEIDSKNPVSKFVQNIFRKFKK